MTENNIPAYVKQYLPFISSWTLIIGSFSAAVTKKRHKFLKLKKFLRRTTYKFSNGARLLESVTGRASMFSSFFPFNWHFFHASFWSLSFWKNAQWCECPSIFVSFNVFVSKAGHKGQRPLLNTVVKTLLKNLCHCVKKCASAGCVGGKQCGWVVGQTKPERAEGPKACRCQPFITVLHSASLAELTCLQVYKPPCPGPTLLTFR